MIAYSTLADELISTAESSPLDESAHWANSLDFDPICEMLDQAIARFMITYDASGTHTSANQDDKSANGSF